MANTPFDGLTEVRDPAEFRVLMARYLDERRDLIRAAARSKLLPAARSLSDSEDVASSVIRRMDAMVNTGEFELRSEHELWALVKLIAERQAIDRGRLATRARSVALDDGPDGALVVKSLAKTSSDDHAALMLHRFLMALADAEERHLLLLRLRGCSYRVIGQQLGFSEDAAKMRWFRIAKSLRRRFVSEIHDERR